MLTTIRRRCSIGNIHDLSSSFDSLHVSAFPSHSAYNPYAIPTLPFVYSPSGYWRRLSPSSPNIPPPHPTLKPIQLFTWNLDFASPHPADRLYAALSHIRNICSYTQPAIINLQGVHASALGELLAHPWVRQFFQVTDVEPIGIYFTMTLVSLSLPVAQVVRYPFKNSKMKRDVLIVDIEVAREGYGVGGGVYRRNDLCEDEVLRIANVHLESTADGIRERPWQMHLVAKLLQQPQVLAGVLAGDVNALLREDEVLPGRNGLGDAFDFTGGKYGGGYGSFGEEETGATWGVGKRGRLGTVRRDKVLYTGNVSFTGGGVVGGKVLKRIGMGLRCETRGRGYNASVSDHCGLATHICIGGLRSLKGRVRRVMDDRLITYRGGRGEW